MTGPVQLQKFHKDPDSVKDYGFNWAPWLGGDQIVTSEWTIAESRPSEYGTDPNYLSIDSELQDATTTTVWLSKGTAGVIYFVRNRVTTQAGRTEDQTLQIAIREQ